MVLFKNIREYPEEKYPEVLSRMVSDVQKTMMSDEDDVSCILCNEHTTNMAVLMPNEKDDAFGKAPAGQRRLIMFTICETHDFNDNKIFSEVDKILIKQWQ